MESLKTSNLSQPFSNVKLLWRVFSRTKLQHRLSYLINEFFFENLRYKIPNDQTQETSVRSKPEACKT